ncbi:MAG: hypothetical protein AAFZ58_13040 [Pseudomonadota bacterium]
MLRILAVASMLALAPSAATAEEFESSFSVELIDVERFVVMLNERLDLGFDAEALGAFARGTSSGERTRRLKASFGGEVVPVTFIVHVPYVDPPEVIFLSKSSALIAAMDTVVDEFLDTVDY